MPSHPNPADGPDGRGPTESAGGPSEPWHYRMVAEGAVVTTPGPESVRDRYLRVVRQRQARRIEGTPTTLDQLHHDQAVQYEALTTAQGMQADIARYPAAAAGELGQAARELEANVQLGGQTGLGPTEFARLWDRVEGGLIGLREAVGNPARAAGTCPIAIDLEARGVRLRQADGSYSDPFPLSPQPLLAVTVLAEAWAVGRPATRAELIDRGVSEPKRALHQAMHELPAIRDYLRMPGRVGRPTVGNDVKYSLTDPHISGQRL